MKKLLSTTAAAFFICSSTVFAAPMTLNVHNSDLRSTIMMVARAGRLNVSVDDSVEGTISMSVANAEPEKILEIIAKTKNLNLMNDGEIFIMTSNFSGSSLMKTYVLPIYYGDAEILRKAVILSLDADDDNDDEKSDKRKDKNSDSKKNTKLKREDRVFVNPDTNSLVLLGTSAEYERAQNLLESLDVELKQVSVEARILAIDKSASKNLGIEWMWSTLPQYPEEDIETYQNSAGVYRERIRRDRNFNDNTGYGIIQFGRGPEGIPFEWYYGARINALVTNGKAQILSRPNVTTIQGHEAVINVGSSVPVPRYETTNSTTTTSLEYRDAGIILKYTPRINADGTITAKIHTEVSTPQYVEDLKAYRFNTRSADTIVTVRDGEPMVIGGLIGAEESKSISKIPFLGDLPLLGALFRNHRKSKSESELIIFLTAHVLEGAGNFSNGVAK